MSRLFVDETLSPLAFAAIAETLIATQLSKTTLDRMFHEEVFPVCAKNALAPIGVWLAIDQQWLNDEIEHYKHSRIYRWHRRIANALFASKGEIEAQWRIIQHHLANPGQLLREIAEMRRASSVD